MQRVRRAMLRPGGGRGAPFYRDGSSSTGAELKSYFMANERFPMGGVARIHGRLLDALAYSHGQGVHPRQESRPTSSCSPMERSRSPIWDRRIESRRSPRQEPCSARRAHVA